MQIFNNSIFNKIFTIIFFSTLGISLAIAINAYISYNFFSLPKINLDEKNFFSKKEKNIKDYKYLKIIFIKDSFNKNIPKKDAKDGIYLQKNNLKNIQSVDNIFLKGVIKLNRKKFAILSTSNNLKLVRENGIFEGYKVKKIENYYVLLEKNGKLFKVSLKFNKSVKINSFSKIDKKNKSFIKNEGNVIQLDKRFIEEKTADIGTLLKDVLLVPEIKNGQTVGFRFKYIKPNSLLYKLGLRSGDLILSVNNMPVRTAEEAFKIYNIVRNEKFINIEIERKGDRKVLTYEVR